MPTPPTRPIPPPGPLRATRHGKDQRNKILTNQTNLSERINDRRGQRHTLTTGFELIYAKSRDRTLGQRRTPASRQPIPANPVRTQLDTCSLDRVRNGAKTKGSTISAACTCSTP